MLVFLKRLKDVSSLSSNVLAASAFSFFLSLVIQSLQALLPIYMVENLGLSMVFIGLVGGVGLFLSCVPQLLTGVLCDLFGFRKKSMIIGSALSLFSLVCYPFIASGFFMGAMYILDKCGLGVIYPSLYSVVGEGGKEKNNMAASFGFRASLSYFGGAFGPFLVAYYLLNHSVKEALFILYIPALLAIAIVLFFISKDNIAKKIKPAYMLSELKKQTVYEVRNFFFGENAEKKKLVMLFFLLSMAKIADAFIIIKGKNIGVPLHLVTLIVVFINVGGVIFSYPVGRWADKIGYNKILYLSSLVMAFAQILFIFNDEILFFFFNILIWGGAIGVSNSILLSSVPSKYSDGKIATGFGVSRLASMFAVFISSVICGILWDYIGDKAVFVYGFVVTVAFFFYNLSCEKQVFKK
jgi:MFS family permease